MKKGNDGGNVQLTDSNQSIKSEDIENKGNRSEIVSTKSSSRIEDVDQKFAKNKEF